MPRTNAVSCATAVGGRSENEDFPISQLIGVNGRTYRVMAVFDGHGGKATAHIASRALVREFRQLLSGQKPFIKRALKALMQRLHELTQHQEAGSTVSIVCIPFPYRKAFMAILGDCPVLIVSRRSVFVGPSHNVGTNLEERQLAINRGANYWEAGPGIGYIGNNLYSVQMSRALGDAAVSSLLNRDPEIIAVPLHQKSTVIVASDGLKNPTEPDEKWLRRMTALAWQSAAASDFVSDGLSHYGSDNVTAIVWRRK